MTPPPPTPFFEQLKDAIVGIVTAKADARQAQLELIKAQTDAAEAVADAARASQRHWWN